MSSMTWELNFNIPSISHRNPATGQFIVGAIPWNKGMKGICIGGKETQFKPGNLPHNSYPQNGVISVRYHNRDGRSYKYIKLEMGKWMLYNRYIWFQHYGPIPEGYIIIHKDKDSMNCEMDNLMMITRAEHARRNANPEKRRESMKKLWKSEKIREKLGLERKTKLRVRL